MTSTQVDYSPKGAGKFVSLIFPDDYNESNPGVPASILMDKLDTDQVGHMWGHIKALEFFWGPELDNTKVNEALNFFQTEYPSLKIQFTSNTILTM